MGFSTESLLIPRSRCSGSGNKFSLCFSRSDYLHLIVNGETKLSSASIYLSYGSLKVFFRMNSNRQAEVQYINNGFPYTTSESFMDLFEGLSYAQADMFLSGALQDQGNPYWPMMHANSYKYGFSSSIGSSYYSIGQLYELNEYAPRSDGGRRVWESTSPPSIEELPQLVNNGLYGGDHSANPIIEERNRENSYTSIIQQYVWQDNIDPDNMTYEELLDLGESVGTQSRGLSQECISSLPVTKYKCSFFSRKKKHCERCIICQMEYRRGDRQTTLPCKHVYHCACISRWLNISKACPVCFAEVPNVETKQQKNRRN
ncbi:hypothetical protein HPP92_024884 [Vanilla planifolia]|nr:hypothetical protein HPP92_024884 [Vanilla planifolia]